MLLIVLSILLVLTALLYGIYRHKHNNWEKKQRTLRDKHNFTFKI
jgi:hypothetical protein